jgi:tRNA-splicing endonuclease subunit Sen15
VRKADPSHQIPARTSSRSATLLVFKSQHHKMVPSTSEAAPKSQLCHLLGKSDFRFSPSLHPPHFHHLAQTVLYNLQFQHDWTSLKIHTHSSSTWELFPRPLLSGIPPKRVYVHPDEQVEVLKAEHETGEKIAQFPEREWILPTHLGETFSLEKFAQVFDAIEVMPPMEEDEVLLEDTKVGCQWRGKNRQKRLLLATLHDDSTVVYYIMHDGIVKPRQK